MSVFGALQALALTGAFASRAFLPLFVVALLARFPDAIAWLPLVPDRLVSLDPRLAWLVSDWCLASLGILALLEAVAERDQDIRAFLAEVDPFLKGAVSFIAAFGLLDPASAQILRTVTGLEVLAAGGWAADGATMLAVVLAGLAGILTFSLAFWRNLVFREAREVADDLGAGRLITWLEEAWSFSAVLLALIAPVVAILLAAAALVLLRLVQTALERARDRSRVACPACATPALPEATACPGCAGVLAPTAPAGSAAWPDAWMGDAEDERPWVLLARGRCPACAERRDPADLLAARPHPCGWPRRAEEAAWHEPFVARVQARGAPLALAAAGLGLFPVAGSVAALVLARMRLALPLRQYVPRGQRFRTRWVNRLVAMPLLLASGVPVASAGCAALLVVIASRTWPAAFRAARGLTPPESPGPRAGESPARSSS